MVCVNTPTVCTYSYAWIVVSKDAHPEWSLECVLVSHVFSKLNSDSLWNIFAGYRYVAFIVLFDSKMSHIQKVASTQVGVSYITTVYSIYIFKYLLFW